MVSFPVLSVSILLSILLSVNGEYVQMPSIVCKAEDESKDSCSSQWNTFYNVIADSLNKEVAVIYNINDPSIRAYERMDKRRLLESDVEQDSHVDLPKNLDTKHRELQYCSSGLTVSRCKQLCLGSTSTFCILVCGSCINLGRRQRSRSLRALQQDTVSVCNKLVDTTIKELRQLSQQTGDSVCARTLQKAKCECLE